jgi:hypothetical protein
MLSQEMFRSVLAVLLLSFLPGAGDVTIEYGSKTELRGVSRVFIDTGTNTDFREHAVAILKRELPAILVSDRVDETVEVVLKFAIDGEGDGKGEATLLVPGKSSSPDAVRLIAKYTDSKGAIWTARLSTVLMKRFIRDYRGAHTVK